MDYTQLTDTELVAMLRQRGDLSQVELELIERLERALDALDAGGTS